MKVQLISDTHGKHEQMIIDETCDTIVHAGDSTNFYNIVKNEVEFISFINWFSILPIKNKILIAGNHDSWALRPHNRDMCKELGIYYLEDTSIIIDNKTFYGSPWSPTFNKWHFMKSRQKLGSFWNDSLFGGIDLLITHTPPKGILDLSESFDYKLEMCGCNGLLKAVKKYEPKHHVFGHVHNNKNIVNFGSRIIGNIQFHNASAVRDGDLNKPPINNKGIIINI